MKGCRDVRARIFAAVEGSLPIEETLAIEEHARACRACALELRRAHDLQAAFAQLPQPLEDRIDVESQVLRIRAAIERDSVPRRTSWFLRTRWIAAAGLLIALAAWWLLHTRSAPTPVIVEGAKPLPHALETAQDEVASPPEQVAAGHDQSVTDVTPQPDTDPSALLPLITDPAEVARLEVARQTVRSALNEVSAEMETAPFLARFDALTADLARARWPLVRLVERVAGEDDLVISTAALRWLGHRGDALSARRVAFALEDPRRKRIATQALLDLWPVGGDALVAAMTDEDLRDIVLDDLVQKDAAGAVNVLVKATRSTVRPLDARIVVEEIAQRRLGAATTWLESFARERSARGDDARAQLAVTTLADLRDSDALRALLRLRACTCAESIGVEKALERTLIDAGPAVTEVARERVAARREREIAELHEVLLSAPGPSIVPALIVLASSRDLPQADRRFAILLAGEQGEARHVNELTELFKKLERSDRSLKAAVLVALHALGGRTAVADALTDVPRTTRERALSVLDGIDAANRPHTTLLQLMKELEPKLAPLQL